MATSIVTIAVSDGGTMRRTTVAVDRMGKEIIEFRPMLKLLSAELALNERRLYATEGRSAGRKWAKLSPRYETRKFERWGRQKIGVASGALRTALISRRHGGHAVRRISEFVGGGGQLEYGTEGLDYASYQQEGFNVPGGFVRPRRPIDWDERQMQLNVAKRVIRVHMQSAARKAKLKMKKQAGDIRGDLTPDID